MAYVVMAIAPKSIRKDSRARLFFHGQDADTDQFVTIYPKKNSNACANVKAGGTYRFSGTLHAFPPKANGDSNIKLIATQALKAR